MVSVWGSGDQWRAHVCALYACPGVGGGVSQPNLRLGISSLSVILSVLTAQAIGDERGVDTALLVVRGGAYIGGVEWMGCV